MGRHAASKDSTVSPPRSNPRALRDLHDALTSPLDIAALDADPIDADQIDVTPSDITPSDVTPIDAADLIARFRESGLLSHVARRPVGPGATGSVNAPALLPLGKKPVLDKAVVPKSAGGPVADPAAEFVLDPAGPFRVADLLNRHPDLAARAPRTGHRAASRTQAPRPTRAGGRTLSALRPAPSISVALRPVLTVAAIITAFALVEGPNLVSTSHASADGGAGSAGRTTSATAPAADTGAIAGANNAVTTAADLPRHGAVTTATSSGRVSRSTRRAIGVAAHHVPLLKPGQTVPGTWIRPSSGRYTSCFCSRWGSFHAGIDLASKLGTPILAVGDGTVIKAGPASGFGNWVVIQHSNGDVSIYGHMKYFFVHAGQKVKAGEKIAVVGDQGFSTGPHLHFEVHKGGLGGTKINPIPWLKARGIVIGSLSKDG